MVGRLLTLTMYSDNATHITVLFVRHYYDYEYDKSMNLGAYNSTYEYERTRYVNNHWQANQDPLKANVGSRERRWDTEEG